MTLPEVTEVRHPIDVDSLAKYLHSLQNNPSATNTTLGVDVPKFAASGYGIKQFAFGQSNPTYLLDIDGKPYVLRKKPSPNAKLVSRSAHAIEREFFLLRGINILNKNTARKVPVPKVYVLCEDESIIGYVFYIMEYIEGDQIKNPDMPGVPDHEKKLYWSSILETITAIHLLDAPKLIAELPKSHFPQFHNLAKITSSSYFERQIRTLTNVEKSQSQTVNPIPHFERITKWTLSRAPRDPAKITLIHGDFKIDNVLFDPKTKKVMAVLDWELCTFGHPIFDLANFLQPFQFPNMMNRMMDESTEIGMENPESIRTIETVLKQYHQAYGSPSWDPKDPTNNASDLWTVGHVFGLIRLCVISQGIGMRIKKGSASSGNAAGFGSIYLFLSELANETIDEYEEKKKLKL